MDTTEEQELLTSLQSDKDFQAAFSKLVQLYTTRLYWHIRNILKDHEDTNDVLQNVFIKVYKSIRSFRGDSKLYSWMYRIATNESITFLNKKAKQNNISIEEITHQRVKNLEADPYYDGDDIQLKLQKAIARLPYKQQQVFNMKYFEDLKYREISEILGTSEGALKASYHLATKKIEEFLKSD